MKKGELRREAKKQYWTDTQFASADREVNRRDERQGWCDQNSPSRLVAASGGGELPIDFGAEWKILACLQLYLVCSAAFVSI
jgi:hypothetical protein